MPPRPLRHRAAAVLLALLYLLAWGEPVALSACPMHDGAGVMAMPMDHAGHAAMGAAGGMHDMAGMAAMHPAGDHPPAQDQGGSHDCRCMASACGASAVMLARAPQQIRWFAVVTRRADPPAAAPPLPRAVAPRHLPPATGPPALG